MIRFQAEDNPFPKSYFDKEFCKKTSPAAFWKSSKNNVGEPFTKFMVVLMNCPASSAGIERLFSNMALIHSKLRNRLGSAKAAKLVSIYRNINKNKWTLDALW